MLHAHRAHNLLESHITARTKRDHWVLDTDGILYTNTFYPEECGANENQLNNSMWPPHMVLNFTNRGYVYTLIEHKREVG